jgi:molybdopterin-binding protein
MLCVEGISKRLGSFAIRAVSFTVEDGDYFVLLGASGVGKTVLLEALAGVARPDEGRILWNDRDITCDPIQKRRMGLVYQDQALFPHMTVRRNIAYGLRSRKANGTALQQQAERHAAEAGVTDLLDRFPATLSGGEAQRVALARALATEPRCLLLDEPISALDAQARTEMRGLLRGLHRKGQTILHVTHDYEEAVSLATRVGIMEKGTVVQVGTPEEVFHHPKSEFVARFIGIRNVFKGRLESEGVSKGATARFVTGGVSFRVLSDAPAGPGMIIIRSEDITVSRLRTETSARNCFKGRVVDVVPARLGTEVTVDIGVAVSALVTAESVERLALCCGEDAWVSFKASAVRFVEE